MKSFAINDAHDVMIENGIVQLADGSALTRQSAECVLNTKIGEWFFNEELGTDHNAMLGKREIDHDELRNIILNGLLQVNETFTISNLTTDYNKNTRKLFVSFTATTEDGESITLSQTWG